MVAAKVDEMNELVGAPNLHLVEYSTPIGPQSMVVRGDLRTWMKDRGVKNRAKPDQPGKYYLGRYRLSIMEISTPAAKMIDQILGGKLTEAATCPS